MARVAATRNSRRAHGASCSPGAQAPPGRQSASNRRQQGVQPPRLGASGRYLVGEAHPQTIFPVHAKDDEAHALAHAHG